MTCKYCQHCERKVLPYKAYYYCNQQQSNKSSFGIKRIQPNDPECYLFELSNEKPYQNKQALRTPDNIKDAALRDYFNNMNDTLKTIAERHGISHTTLSVWISAHYKAKFARVASLRGAG